MDFTTYRDKVLGCWNGKNIGGTLGRHLNAAGAFLMQIFIHRS